MKYQPKRARARWLQDAPEWVLSVHDNGGKSADRYTVFFGGSQWLPEFGRNVFYLSMSESPGSAYGICISGECPSINRSNAGKKIRWLDLPKACQEAATRFANDE